jgi:hypothetical protein
MVSGLYGASPSEASGYFGASPTGVSGSGASPTGTSVSSGVLPTGTLGSTGMSPLLLWGHCVLLGHCHRQCQVLLGKLVVSEIQLKNVLGKPHSSFTWLTAAQFKGGNRG